MKQFFSESVPATNKISHDCFQNGGINHSRQLHSKLISKLSFMQHEKCCYSLIWTLKVNKIQIVGVFKKSFWGPTWLHFETFLWKCVVLARVAKHNQQPAISLAQNHLLKAHGEKDCAGALRRKQEMEQNPSSSLFLYQPLPISSTMSIFLFFLSSCNIANKNPSLVFDRNRTILKMKCSQFWSQWHRISSILLSILYQRPETAHHSWYLWPKFDTLLMISATQNWWAGCSSQEGRRSRCWEGNEPWDL